MKISNPVIEGHGVFWALVNWREDQATLNPLWGGVVKVIRMAANKGVDEALIDKKVKELIKDFHGTTAVKTLLTDVLSPVIRQFTAAEKAQMRETLEPYKYDFAAVAKEFDYLFSGRQDVRYKNILGKRSVAVMNMHDPVRAKLNFIDTVSFGLANLLRTEWRVATSTSSSNVLLRSKIPSIKETPRIAYKYCRYGESAVSVFRRIASIERVVKLAPWLPERLQTFNAWMYALNADLFFVLERLGEQDASEADASYVITYHTEAGPVEYEDLPQLPPQNRLGVFLGEQAKELVGGKNKEVVKLLARSVEIWQAYENVMMECGIPQKLFASIAPHLKGTVLIQSTSLEREEPIAIPDDVEREDEIPMTTPPQLIAVLLEHPGDAGKWQADTLVYLRAFKGVWPKNAAETLRTPKQIHDWLMEYFAKKYAVTEMKEEVMLKGAREVVPGWLVWQPRTLEEVKALGHYMRHCYRDGKGYWQDWEAKVITFLKIWKVGEGVRTGIVSNVRRHDLHVLESEQFNNESPTAEQRAIVPLVLKELADEIKEGATIKRKGRKIPPEVADEIAREDQAAVALTEAFAPHFDDDGVPRMVMERTRRDEATEASRLNRRVVTPRRRQ